MMFISDRRAFARRRPELDSCTKRANVEAARSVASSLWCSPSSPGPSGSQSELCRAGVARSEARWAAPLPLAERLVEGRNAVVPHVLRDLSNAALRIAEQLGSAPHSPAREVLQRRLAYQRRKASGKGGPRKPYLLRERRDRPPLAELAVKER